MIALSPEPLLGLSLRALWLLLDLESIQRVEDFRHCCESVGPHAPGCPLDELLTDVGLSSPEAREKCRKALPRPARRVAP